jgi:hypothetical protein
VQRQSARAFSYHPVPAQHGGKSLPIFHSLVTPEAGPLNMITADVGIERPCLANWHHHTLVKGSCGIERRAAQRLRGWIRSGPLRFSGFGAFYSCGANGRETAGKISPCVVAHFQFKTNLNTVSREEYLPHQSLLASTFRESGHHAKPRPG